MVKIVSGSSWRLNPSYLATLRQVDERSARRFSPSSIFDSLGIEVDGVSLSRGLSETAVFEVVGELAQRVLQLLEQPGGGTQVALEEGKVELVIGRRGNRAALALVSLARPAHVLAGEVEVELGALAMAVASCATELASALKSINPALASSPACRKLNAVSASLRKANPTPGSAAEAREAAKFRATCKAPDGSLEVSFAFEDAHGRLRSARGGDDLYSLLVPGELALAVGGEVVAKVGGPPFLTLGEAVRSAVQLAGAAEMHERRWKGTLGPRTMLELDLEKARLISSRSLPCAPLALARAFLDAALGFEREVTARSPAQARNAYLTSLAERAREGLARLGELEGGDLFSSPGPDLGRPAAPKAGAPLAAGRLKRLRYRLAWGGVDVGGATALAVRGRSLIAAGPRSVTWIDARTGSPRLARPCESAGIGERTVLLTRGAHLEGWRVDGSEAWLRLTSRQEQPVVTEVAGAGPLGKRAQPGTLAVLDRHVVAAVLDATGRSAWLFRAPQAGRVAAARLGDRVFVTSDGGAVYALSAEDGDVELRVRTGLSLEGRLALGARVLAFAGRREGALWLAAIDPSSGRPLFSRPLHLSAAGTPATWRGKLLVPGEADGEAAVVALNGSGKEIFRARLGAAGVPTLLAQGAAVYCALPGGGVRALGSAGQVLWSAPAKDAEGPRSPAPVLRRGVLLVPGEPIRALDPASGALLCELPLSHGLAAMAVGPGLDVYAVDDHGVASRFALAVHLAVV